MVKCSTKQYETTKSKLTVRSQYILFYISTDIWTGIAIQDYITVNAHFSPNWELNTFLLQTMCFPKNHTAE